MGFLDSIKAAFTTPTKMSFTPDRAAIVWSESQLEESATIAPTWGHLDVGVAGVSNYQPQIRWASAYANAEIGNRFALALLEFEPENPYDKKAIKVTIQGHLVGYIFREDQAHVAPIVRRAIKATGAATCVGKFLGGTDEIPIGIRLDLP